MNARKLTVTDYNLLGFLFSVDEEGKHLMKTSRCGSFVSAEEAIDAAKELADIQWRVLAEKEAGVSESKAIRITPTEWGYDILRGNIVLERFWVYDSHPTEASSL